MFISNSFDFSDFLKCVTILWKCETFLHQLYHDIVSETFRIRKLSRDSQKHIVCVFNVCDTRWVCVCVFMWYAHIHFWFQLFSYEILIALRLIRWWMSLSHIYQGNPMWFRWEERKTRFFCFSKQTWVNMRSNVCVCAISNWSYFPARKLFEFKESIASNDQKQHLHKSQTLNWSVDMGATHLT